MARDFDGKVVWITGGGSGIGKACAVEFARQGAAVVVSGRRQERLDAVVTELESTGATAVAVPCDVTVETEVVAAVAAIVGRFERLDVVLANAGFSVAGRLDKLDVASWKRQFDVNVIGLVSTVHHALPQLRRTGGRIGLVASVASYTFAPGFGAYNSSKAAVRAIGETLYGELAGTGVSVTTLHPGFVESEINQVDNQGRFHADREDKRPGMLMWKSDRAARVMVRALFRRQRERVFTGHGHLGVFIARYFPRTTAALLALGGRRMNRKAAPPPPAIEDRPTPYSVPVRGPLVRRRIKRSPSLVRTYLRGLARVRGRQSGKAALSAELGVPPIVVTRTGLVPDGERLALYAQITGHKGSPGALPLCFPEALFHDLMAEAILSPAFPLSPLGLIHIRQSIAQDRPIPSVAPLDLRAQLMAITATHRGAEVEFGLDLRQGGEVCWRGLATLLSRDKGVGSGGSKRRREVVEPPPERERFDVAADTGRVYAKAARDFNPHHLWTWTARPLGYKRPIAHGMWTMARAVASVWDRSPGPVTVDVAFKRPLFMPGTAALHVGEPGEGGPGRAFEVRDVSTGVPHLAGRISAPGDGEE